MSFFFITFVAALAISSIGFKRFIWFISIGYGFSIAGIGLILLALFWTSKTPLTVALCLLLVVYGCRLGGYLLLREIKSSSYQQTMKTEVKDGSSMKIGAKIAIWITCALLYACEASPVLFRLSNGSPDDLCGIIGLTIMLGGIVLESVSDFTKNSFKKNNPHRFCDVGVFRLVRCPNYLGEIMTWTGVLVSSLSILTGPLQWAAALFGFVCIVYIMFGGARRLEIRQNKNYGDNPEYQDYVKRVPILLPFIPLYSVEKYRWLVG